EGAARPGARDARSQAPGPGRLATEPARRPMTVLDLLRHTSGFAGGHRGSAALGEAYRRVGIAAFDHTESAYTTSSAELVSRLASLPLAHHPGTVWEYGRSGDVLGRLLEVVAGQRLDVLLRERVLGPLGMVDTGFHVPPEQAHRVVAPLAPFTPGDEIITLVRPPRFLSGGSGCYGTVADTLRLARVLLAGGTTPDGVEVFSKASIGEATTDQLGQLYGTGPDYIPGAGYGFGFGLAVRRGPGPGADLWWLGRASTSFLVDARRDLVAILFTQRYWSARNYEAWFRRAIYQAIVD
ncbi:MAG: serine hydrolase domain-containing protein, partial [Micromonosporaceae bacterium]